MRSAHLSTTSNVIDDCNMPAPILTHFAPHFISNFNGSLICLLLHILLLKRSLTSALRVNRKAWVQLRAITFCGYTARYLHKLHQLNAYRISRVRPSVWPHVSYMKLLKQFTLRLVLMDLHYTFLADSGPLRGPDRPGPLPLFEAPNHNKN
jgi:hypothetical protein